MCVRNSSIFSYFWTAGKVTYTHQIHKAESPLSAPLIIAPRGKALAVGKINSTGKDSKAPSPTLVWGLYSSHPEQFSGSWKMVLGHANLVSQAPPACLLIYFIIEFLWQLIFYRAKFHIFQLRCRNALTLRRYCCSQLSTKINVTRD